MSIVSSNWAKETPFISLTLVEVISSGIEKRYVVFSELPTHTSPERSVKKRGVLLFVAPRFTSPIFIWAIAAVLERGT